MSDILGLTYWVMSDLLRLYTMGLLFYLFLSSICIAVFHNFSLLNHIYIIFNYFSIIFTIRFSIKNYIWMRFKRFSYSMLYDFKQNTNICIIIIVFWYQIKWFVTRVVIAKKLTERQRKKNMSLHRKY